MPSVALDQWKSTAQTALDEIEAAHVAVGGHGRGRRYATLQVNYAYAMLLSSQFQGFCRNLHSEAVDFLAANTQPPWSADLLRVVLTQERQLDRGNPTPDRLRDDYARLGMQLWPAVQAVDGRWQARREALRLLNDWRNAIARQDCTRVGGHGNLWLGTVQGWRSACDGLARSFDRAVSTHLLAVVGARPW